MANLTIKDKIEILRREEKRNKEINKNSVPIAGWIAVDSNGDEWLFSDKPTRVREEGQWVASYLDFPDCELFQLPDGTTKQITGRQLGFKDDPLPISDRELFKCVVIAIDAFRWPRNGIK